MGRPSFCIWFHIRPSHPNPYPHDLRHTLAHHPPTHLPPRPGQVFFGSDFVTVTKSEDYGWAVLKPDVFAAITEFYAAEEPLFYDEAAPGAAEHIITEDDDEASQRCCRGGAAHRGR